MISKELSATLGFAVKEAKKRRHEYVSIEHILFAILNDPNGVDIIENCGGDIENLLDALENFLMKRSSASLKEMITYCNKPLDFNGSSSVRSIMRAQPKNRKLPLRMFWPLFS
jgi:ATP-dependent Clp protease ATP-binding subunit ClpA